MWRCVQRVQKMLNEAKVERASLTQQEGSREWTGTLQGISC